MTYPAHPLSPARGPSASGPEKLQGGFKSALRRVASAALKLVLLLAGLVFMLTALVAASVLATGLLAWALLRGRRPAPGVFQAYYQRARKRQRPGSEPLVVDVEAVEVPGPASTRQAR